MTERRQGQLRKLTIPIAVGVALGLSSAVYADTGTTKIRINLREAPDLNTAVVKTLPQGSELQILGYEGEFAMLQTADGDVGYLKTKYLEVVEAAPEPVAPVAPEPEEVAQPEAPAAPVEAAPVAAAPAAPAEEESTDELTSLSRISVTGSRLRRTDIEGASPVIEVSRADIDRIGLADLGDVIRQLPVVTGSPLSSRTNNGGDGSTSVDLRGVGRQRTLVLINGRRDISGNDFSTIPLAIVEKIEILPQGASAIYGADAVAGVVNIITRRDHQGVEINAFASTFPGLETNPAAAEVGDPNLEGTDGENYRASIVIGGASAKGRFTAGFEYNRQNEFYQGNVSEGYLRDALSFTDLDDVAAAGFGAFNRDIDGDGDVGIVVGGSSAQLNGFFNVPEGGPFEAGIYTIGEDGQPRTRVPEDAFNFGPVNFLQTPFIRNNAFFSGDYLLENGVEVYAEARYARRTSDQALAPLPYFSLFDPPGTIPASNFYNPFGVDLGDIRRRIAEVGGRSFTQERSLNQITVGARGELGFVDMWDWEAFYQYGRFQQTDVDGGQFVGSRLQNALGPSFQAADGTITCGTPDAPIANCVPLNLFGNVGTITPEMLNYVQADLVDFFQGTRNFGHLSFAGPIMPLPGGELTAAIALETREEFFSYTPDSGKATEAVTGNAGEGLAGGYDVDSISIEISAPLLSGAPFAQALELGFGFRQDDYSTVGSNNVFQVNALWQPIESVVVRASFAEVFREPSILELFSPQSDNFPEYVDPCSTGNIDAPDDDVYNTLTPEQQAQCTQTGVPEGGYFQSNAQPRGRIGGNPDLAPEQGDTFNIGVVWDPDFIPGGSFTLDYFSIELEDAIAAISERSIVERCVLELNDAACSNITRFADGQINAVVALQQNIGKETAKGIDFAFNHVLNTRVGSFNSRVMVTRLEERESTVTTPFDAVGQFVNDVEALTRGIYPEYRANAIVDWGFEKYGASLNVDYIGGVTEELTADLSRDVSATYYVDTAFRYFFNSTAMVSFGINNLFDEQPEFIVGEFNAQTDTDTYRIGGRQLYLSTRLDFN